MTLSHLVCKYDDVSCREKIIQKKLNKKKSYGHEADKYNKLQ